MYDYFFSGNQYIRVTRGDTGPGVVDAEQPVLELLGRGVKRSHIGCLTQGAAEVPA